MSCAAFERLIALDVGGDLAPAEAARLGAHLASCAACRELAAGLRASQDSLRALGGEGLDEDAVVAWRRGLMARIEDAQPRRLLGWWWAWVAAAAMAVLVGFLIVPQLQKRTPPVRLVGQAVPPALGRPNGLPHPPQPPVAHRSLRHHRAPAPAAETLLVKLETPDPNVVIYWIVEGKGN